MSRHPLGRASLSDQVAMHGLGCTLITVPPFMADPLINRYLRVLCSCIIDQVRDRWREEREEIPCSPYMPANDWLQTGYSMRKRLVCSSRHKQ